MAKEGKKKAVVPYLVASVVTYFVFCLFFWSLHLGVRAHYLGAYKYFSDFGGNFGSGKLGAAIGYGTCIAFGLGLISCIVVLARKHDRKGLGILSSLFVMVFSVWAGLALTGAKEWIREIYHAGETGKTVMLVLVALFLVASVILGFVAALRASHPVAVAEKAEEPVKEEEKPEEKPAEEEKPTEEPVKEEEPKKEEKPVEEPVKEEELKKEEKPVEEEKPAEEPVKEEPAKEEPKEEEKPEEKPVEEAKEEPAPAPLEEEKPVEEVKPEEKPVEEAKPVIVAAGEEEKAAPVFERISFAERLDRSEDILKDEYKEIKKYALSYGIKSRVTSTGDTFRLHTVKYLKMIVAGKKLKLYFKLDPKKYLDSTIPVEDVSSKELYKETPLAFKVRSPLSVKRAKMLIDDMMKEAGFTKGEEPADVALPAVPVKEEKPVEEEEPVEDVKPAEEEKPAEEAAPVAAPAVAEEKTADTRYSGKYEVYPEAGLYKFRLKASNGEILLVSNGYVSKDGAKAGIETLKKNIPNGVTNIVTDKNGYSQFRIYTANGARLVIAGEIYSSAASATSALASVEKFAPTDKIVELDSIDPSEVREFVIDLPEADKKPNGKIEYFIDEDSKKWKARLVASNGEVLFVTMTYASKQGAVSGIEAIKAKANANAFHVVRDKQNRYQFKLTSDNGQVLVMGETYSSKDSASSAAASVRSFINDATPVDLTKVETPAPETAPAAAPSPDADDQK